MTEEHPPQSTKVVAASPQPNAVARGRLEKKVAAAVVINGYAVSKVAAKFGLTPEEVREIFRRRCPSASDVAER